MVEGLETKCENERFALSALGREQWTRTLVGHVCRECAQVFFVFLFVCEPEISGLEKTKKNGANELKVIRAD